MKRVNNPQKKIKNSEHGEELIKMEIVQFADGYVECRKIPAGYDLAMSMLNAAVVAVGSMFIKYAKANQLNDKNVIDGSKIVLVKGNANLN